jgi:hypothetical protein
MSEAFFKRIMHVNYFQFSEIIKYKKILWQVYIKNINAICVIVQDWIIPKNILIFYTVNCISILTNFIHFIPTTDYKKTKKGSKVYNKLPIYLLGGKVGLRFGEMDTYYIVEQFANNGIRQFITVTTDNSNIQSLSLKDIKNNNWHIRKHFAILCITLRIYFIKNNKKAINNADKVFNYSRFNRHIAQFL